MNLQLMIDTENAVKQYKVVVIDCWSVLGDHAIPPEPKIVATFDAGAVEKVVGDKGTVLVLTEKVVS